MSEKKNVVNRNGIKKKYVLGEDFWTEETAIGVVEIILILVVLISLVLIFKKQLTSLVNAIFLQINSKTKSVY